MQDAEAFQSIHCVSSEDLGSAAREEEGVTEFYLHNNRLEQLPEAIGHFGRLRALDVSGNRLTSLVNQLMLLTRLQLLDCSHNSLTTLPFIQPLCNTLTRIYLNHNKFTEFPFELTDLVNLRKLDISFNRISLIPVEIGNLQHLKYLWAERNRIVSLPRSVSKLINLIELHLDSNRLNYLPTEVRELKKLSALGLLGNPLRTFPRDVQQAAYTGNLRKVQDYLNEIENGSRSYNRVKLMFVGEGGVGKTSLLGCFNREKEDDEDDDPDAPENESDKKDKKKKKSKKNRPNIATDGVDIATAKWNKYVTLAPKLSHACMPYTLPLSCSIWFRAWDFAGQDLYHTTHQFFLSKRSIYLVVFNLLHMLQRKSDATAKVHERLHDAAQVVCI